MDRASNEEMLDLQRECIEQVHFYVNLAATKLGIEIPVPKIIFDRMGLVAGRAHFNPDNLNLNYIKFNPALLRTNGEDFIKRTPGHEVAHLVTRARFGMHPRPHGHEWKLIMNRFGLPAIRCHNYDVSAVTGGRPKKVIVIKQDDMKITQIKGARMIQFD